MAPPVDRPVGLEVISDTVVGREGGFLAIRRLRLRNVRADGSRSREYLCDFVQRPVGVDAVAVVLYTREGGGARVLVREGLRPTLYFGRNPESVPVVESPPSYFLTEIVAGILEAEDRGEEGVLRRAVLEVEEEAGLRVPKEAVKMLGPPAFLSPGALPEKLHFVAVEVDAGQLAAVHPAEGDGSPFEEGAESQWLDLDDALARCSRGELCDVKTELGLRRLKEHLAR